MVLLLTCSLVVLALGLTLLVISFTGRKAPAAPPGSPEAYQAEAAPPPRRALRPVPLVLGLGLAIAGGIAAAMILTADERKLDQYVLQKWPADWLVDDLNSDDPRRRSDAFHELTRRYQENLLTDSAHNRLAARQSAFLTNDRQSPEAPLPNAPVVEIDLVKARIENRLDAKGWATYVARSTPLRLDVPRRSEAGAPLELRMDASLADPAAPAWVIIKVESLTVGGRDVDPPAPVAVAPNPTWKPPPPPEPQDQSTPALAMGGGGRVRPPVIRRVVRYPHTVPAEVISALGPGSHEVHAKIRVYAFDPSVVPAPVELLSDAATGVPRRQEAPEGLEAAVLSGLLTPQQFEELSAKATAMQEWPDDGEVQIGDPAPATQPAADEPDAQSGAGAGDAAGSGQ